MPAGERSDWQTGSQEGGHAQAREASMMVSHKKQAGKLAGKRESGRRDKQHGQARRQAGE